MKRGRLLAAVELALLVIAGTLPAQVVMLGGGVSTVADTEGVGATVYEPDTTTQSSIGFAQGFHLGTSREVRSDSLSLTAGDSNLSLALPTDLQDEYRFLQIRGAVLQTRNSPTAVRQGTAAQPVVSGRAAIGWTGNGYQNPFFRSIEASKAVQLAELHLALNRRFEVSTIAVRGTQKSLLGSAAWLLRPNVSAAFTAGWSSGKPIFRARLSGKGSTWQGAMNYTAGTLHLQPEPSLAFFTLERTGLNANISKRIGGWLYLDASRNQYDTSSAVDGAQYGVTAARSTFNQAGFTARKDRAEAGVRYLQSTSGSQVSSGIVVIAGWNMPRWSVRSTAVRNVSQVYGITHSAIVSSTQRVSQHLRVTEGTTFANGAPTIDLGGAYENRFGGITVSHREAFVPFGTEAGFHRLLAIGIHLHLGSTDVAANQITGKGLPTNYDLAVNGFYGDSLGTDAAGRNSAVHRMPGYTVQGRVTTAAGEPIRGAAVNVGKELVYAGSDGNFSAQLERPSPVEVSLAPAQFLTPGIYRAVSATTVVKPSPVGSGEPLVLQAAACRGCDAPSTEPLVAKDHETVRGNTLRSQVVALRSSLAQLGRRMLHLWPRRQDA